MTKEYDIIATAVSADQLFQIKSMKPDSVNSRLQFFEINNILLQDLPGSALINVCRIMMTGESPIIEYAVQYNCVFTPTNLLANLYKSQVYSADNKGSIVPYPNGFRLRFTEDTALIKTQESIGDGMNKLDESLNLTIVSTEKEKSPGVGTQLAVTDDRPVYIKLSGFETLLNRDKKKTVYFMPKDVRLFKQDGNKISVTTVSDEAVATVVEVVYNTERSASIAMKKFIQQMNIKIL